MHLQLLVEQASATETPPAFSVVRKRVGKKVRAIAVPNASMRVLHRLLINELEAPGYLLESATAKKGSSIIQNVRPHLHARSVYLLDFAHAYRSVPVQKLAASLHFRFPTFGTEREIAHFLKQYCFVPRHGLAQGAPASPLLFELYAEWEVDTSIRQFLERVEDSIGGRINYTRYVDDLTFSALEPIPAWVRRGIRSICMSAGFSIQHRKSVVGSLGTKVVEVTGVHLLAPGRAMLSRDFCNTLERTLDTYLSQLFSEPDLRLEGMIVYYVGMMRALGDVRASNRRTVRIDKKIKAYRLRTGFAPSHKRKTFSNRTLDAIRAQLPVSQIVSRSVALKRAGKEYKGLSPFKVERTPSFFVNDQKGFYHCFASGSHGDIFTFVMFREQCGFVEAVEMLAKEAGVSLDYD
ncbi:MAG: hypothetical protein KBE09_04600 [Candidatus Pacebacteria bacterium]|nr:hypothetical protein [Candidatus Paceibacterota bacterium]